VTPPGPLQKALFAAIGVVFVAMVALARPPEGQQSDPAQEEWYKSLVMPKTHLSCCSIADCRPVKARHSGDEWEVFIDSKSFDSPEAMGDDKWHKVSPENILDREPNPTGSAVACWYGGEVRCFIRPAEA
jgi:hypothetical protein